MNIFVLTLHFTFVIFLDFVQFSSQSGTEGSSSSTVQGIPPRFRNKLSKPSIRFPGGLLKVPLLEPPYEFVDLPEGVPYIALANFNYDVFGVYDRKGHFQRFFDAKTLKHVSINMGEKFEATIHMRKENLRLKEISPEKSESIHLKRHPLTELSGPEIAYLEERFGSTFEKLPYAFQTGMHKPEYVIPPNHVVVWNQEKRAYEEVPSNVAYKTLANFYEEIFGIYDHGHFRRFYNIRTHKPAALKMELDAWYEKTIPYARDLEGDEIQFIRTKFGGN